MGIGSVISFVAPYVYMMPALHCPFIFLDAEHYNFGYLVYLPLFGAAFLGMSAGIVVALGSADFQLWTVVSQAMQIRFMLWSRLLWLAFLAAAYGPVIRFWIATGGKADLFQVGH